MEVFKLIFLILISKFAENSCMSTSAEKDLIQDFAAWVRVPNSNGTWSWVNMNQMSIPPYNEETDVQFWLFSKKNPDVGQLIKLRDNTTIEESNFDKNKRTHVLIHGWTNDLNTTFSQISKNATVKAGDFNVIVVDWGKVAHLDYPVAARRTKNVGITVASLLNFWYVNGYLESFDNVTLAGHSLGAHVSGVAGKHTLKKVAVLYALDPAGPMFAESDTSRRVDKNDAQLTVGLRTNCGPMAYGYQHVVAQMEFLPNGGQTQPGCDLYFWSFCSHQRAEYLYAESLLSDKFVGMGCKDFDEVRYGHCSPTGTIATFVGENITNQHGYYYFRTDYVSPFGLGPAGENY